MASIQARAIEQQQQNSNVFGHGFDEAQFSASRLPRETATTQASGNDDASEVGGTAASVFAGLTTKLSTWQFAPDSWRTEDVM